MAAGKKTEAIKGVYIDCPYDDGIPAEGSGLPDNYADCGKNTRYISRTMAEVVDLVSEDGVDGLVYQEYELTGTEGNLGYDSVTTKTLGNTTDPEKAKLCSTYWDEIPLIDKDSGNFNFTDIETVSNQSILKTSGLTNKRVKVINQEIKGSEENTTSHYKYYKVYNKYCSKITLSLKVGQLGKVDRYKGTRNDPNEGYGELLDSTVSVSFYYRALYSSHRGGFDEGVTETVKGNLSSPYVRDVVLALPLSKARGDAEDEVLGWGDFLGWEIKIIRNTEEPKTPDTKNSTLLDTITEEIEAPLTAPQSYVIKSNFSAEYFSQIPSRTYDVRLQKVRIPSNYDPITKTYQGNWDGTFSDELNDNGKTNAYGKKPNGDPYGAEDSRPKGYYWSNNPAWCFYDLIANKRYGLGKYVSNVTFDKWTLYDIAQYCDELVSDGDGKLEPRFTCNILIQSREDAFQVLNDMASVFRAIVYYSSGTVYAVQDALKDSVFQFTNANVENGEFTYSTTSAKVRHTVAIIRYNDKNNFYKPAVEYVDDVEGIRRYGIREKEVSAFGCTSRGQAIRLGRWILATERLETETATFKTGAEGALVRPGDVFTISDSHRLMKRRGGRVEGFTRISDSQFTILLDSKLEALDSSGDGEDGNDKGRNYQLTLSAPSFFYDPSQTEIDNSTETQYIRNHHVQKFTVTNEDIDYDSGSTGKSLVTINCTNCLNTAGTEINLGDVVDRMSWSILTHGEDDTAGSIQEKLNQDLRYRAINVNEEEISKFEIAAVEYREEKYAEIDHALVYENTLTFNQPTAPTAFTITDPSEEITPNTKAINYDIDGPATNNGLSYYAIFVKEGSDFSSGVPDEQYLVDKIYSINVATGRYIPARQANYYFRAYAVNSLGQYSTGYAYPKDSSGALASVNPGAVNPIRDIEIKSLRLTDDSGTNVSGVSDPLAGTTYSGSTTEKVDLFDGSDIQIAWETAIPDIPGVNIAIGFDFRIRIYDWTEANGKGALLKTVAPYRPIDWDLAFTTFEFSLEDVIGVSANIYSVKRAFTFEVDAFVADVDGNNPEYSSTGNTAGFDRLHVWNKPPRDASTPAGFLDINAHIKIFDVDRPIDARAVYIIAAKKTFNAGNFQSTTDRADDEFAFDWVKISPIVSDDPVFEMDPAFKTDDLEVAWVSTAYFDDFDADVLAYATENEIAYDETKLITSDRLSTAKKLDKVTPEIMDLIGEGWKAWIKIDLEGNWYGRNIECIEDKSDAAENQTFKGYLPFYCGRRIPILRYRMIHAANYVPGSVSIMTGRNTLHAIGDYFSASCLYYLPRTPNDRANATVYPNTYTNEKKFIGGYVTPAQNNPEGLFEVANDHGYDGEKFTKTFRRFRVHFKPGKGFMTENATGGYWVMGMNVNHKAYFDQHIIEAIQRLPNFSADDFGWETEMSGGAFTAFNDLTETQKTNAYIGGSDAFFNYNPAGFVQGWGGLHKSDDCFDIHLGHMIDGSYLKEAIFFVMATNQDLKTKTHNHPAPACP